MSKSGSIIPEDKPRAVLLSYNWKTGETMADMFDELPEGKDYKSLIDFAWAFSETMLKDFPHCSFTVIANQKDKDRRAENFLSSTI